jgi:hypothetical protein
MLKDGGNCVVLSIPSTIHHDYAGACILVSHRVELAVELRGICTQTLKTSLVLNVVSPKIVKQALLAESDSNSIAMLDQEALSQTLLPEGWDIGTTLTAPVANKSTPSNTILGGTATSSDAAYEMNFDNFTPKKSQYNVVSIKKLISEMRFSNNPFITVSNTLHDAAWNHFLAVLVPWITA